MNLLLWTGEVTEDHLPILESLKAMGYDGVEIPIFNLESDYTLWGNRLDDLGLGRTAVTVRTEEDNPQKFHRQSILDCTGDTAR